MVLHGGGRGGLQPVVPRGQRVGLSVLSLSPAPYRREGVPPNSAHAARLARCFPGWWERKGWAPLFGGVGESDPINVRPRGRATPSAEPAHRW